MSSYTCFNEESGDGFLPYSQATVLSTALGENNCSLFELTDVAHGEFGEGTNKKIHPNTNIQDEVLKATIDAYYEEIASKLQFNS